MALLDDASAVVMRFTTNGGLGYFVSSPSYFVVALQIPSLARISSPSSRPRSVCVNEKFVKLVELHWFARWCWLLRRSVQGTQDWLCSRIGYGNRLLPKCVSTAIHPSLFAGLSSWAWSSRRRRIPAPFGRARCTLLYHAVLTSAYNFLKHCPTCLEGFCPKSD